MDLMECDTRVRLTRLFFKAERFKAETKVEERIHGK